MKARKKKKKIQMPNEINENKRKKEGRKFPKPNQISKFLLCLRDWELSPFTLFAVDLKLSFFSLRFQTFLLSCLPVFFECLSIFSIFKKLELNPLFNLQGWIFFHLICSKSPYHCLLVDSITCQPLFNMKFADGHD